MVIRRRASTNNRSGGGAVLCWQSEASVSLSYVLVIVTCEGKSQIRTAAQAVGP